MANAILTGVAIFGLIAFVGFWSMKNKIRW